MVVDVRELAPKFHRRAEVGDHLKIAFLKLSKSTVSILGLWLVICGGLLLQGWRGATVFSDSDDALRLVLVRELVSGRGWYDQKVLRIEPPDGVWLHWSRLLDGALAAPLWMLQHLMGPAHAEFWLRLLWPLILILPMLFAARALVRLFNPEPSQRSTAEIAAAAITLVCLPLYAQFHPGRIDHHNMQLLFCLTAFAGAAGRGRRSAAVAGGAMGLGLAVGLEAIAFEVAIAAFMALRMLVQPEEASRVRAFAVALAAALVAAFLAQTPPMRWGVSACDALGLNLELGVVAGSTLLVAASFVSHAALRLALTIGAGVAAAATCLAFDPSCVHGPFAHVDPHVFDAWLKDVQETRSIPQLLQTDFATGLTLLTATVFALVAWLVLGLWPAERRRPAYLLLGLMLLIAAVSTWGMLRASSYLMWAAIPAGATLAARLASKLSRNGSAPAVRAFLFGLILAPTLPAGLVVAAMKFHPTPAPLAKTAAAVDGCFNASAYRELAGLPPGLAVAETDLGAFVLAYTPSTVLAAPYHRADKGILAAHAILAAPTDRARGLVRAAGATYVLTCPAHAARDDTAFGPSSLRAVLDTGRPPGWLVRVSKPRRAIQIFRVSS